MFAASFAPFRTALLLGGLTLISTGAALGQAPAAALNGPVLAFAPLQQFVDQKGQLLAQAAGQAEMTFTLLDSPEVNAYSTPDGRVYITRGLLAHCTNEAQLIGVMAHEVGHIAGRHGQQALSPSASTVVPKRLAALAPAAALGPARRFERDDERDADARSVTYASQLGYNASLLAGFFQNLERLQRASTEVFLASHPRPADRSRAVQQLAGTIQPAPGTQALTINRDAYLRLLEGLPYGPDPRQSFMEGNTWYYPALKTRFAVPKGWKWQYEGQQLRMADPKGKLLLQWQLVPGVATLKAASEALAAKLNLRPTESRHTTVNGFTGFMYLAEQQAPGQAGPVRVRVQLFQDGPAVYALIAAAAPEDFGPSEAVFEDAASGFERLADASKLSRQPEYVRIKTATAATTLAQALAANGVPAARHEEMAVLNGMQLTDPLTAGSLYKVVGQ